MNDTTALPVAADLTDVLGMPALTRVDGTFLAKRPRTVYAERSDVAGLIRANRNRTTGTLVLFVYAAAQGIDSDDRYATICDEHGTLMTQPKRALATWDAAHPEQWCEDCAEIAAF